MNYTKLSGNAKLSDYVHVDCLIVLACPIMLNCPDIMVSWALVRSSHTHIAYLY